MEATELISRCKAGERQALNLLYQQYKPQLLNICKQYAKEDDVAEDLLHDAFVVIFTSLDRLENADKLEAWMYAIVRNVGYHYRQHADKELAALQQLAKEKPNTTETGHIADYNELKSLVTLLPQGYQQVFRLSVFEGLSHQEISQLLGITPHSSSSQLSHAKRMLRQLIRQSWVLVFLLIAIPAAIWQFLKKEKEPENQLPVISETNPKPQPTTPVEKPDEQPVYVAINKHPSSHPIRYQAETVILPDSIPYQKQEEQTETPTETPMTTEAETSKDTVVYQSLPLPSADELFTTELVSTSRSWNISVAYNGLIGLNDNYLSAASGSFSNWIDYNYYLNNSPSVPDDAETRSLMNIAAQNSLINSGMMEARYEHKRPTTLQVLFNHKLSKLLSIETGLSYTRLASTISTGSSNAYIQEQQRQHYLGIPFRLGWQWYRKSHLSLYSSAGIMLELPIKSAVDICHIANGINTFQKKTSLDTPIQWSTNLGLGLQYDFTPHFGVYLEPSLQYFFNDGSSIKTYRTEHPLQIALPLGIRFRW